MNPHMTDGAVLISWIGHVVGRRLHHHARAMASESTGPVVTLEANGKDHRTPQQPGVGGAVRKMAALTAFHPNGRVFEGERTCLVPVTPEAGFF